MATTKRHVRVFRYDPAVGGDGAFRDYDLECPNESAMTMLDVLLRIQREQDPTIAFRFACRVAMCG
jgi:succinate dehydrogenase / fumarate reductase iron-sulfur subunit